MWRYLCLFSHAFTSFGTGEKGRPKVDCLKMAQVCQEVKLTKSEVFNEGEIKQGGGFP